MYAKMLSKKIVNDKWTIKDGEVLRIAAKRGTKYIVKSEINGNSVCVDESEIQLMDRPKFF
jgi:hypothetical protein